MKSQPFLLFITLLLSACNAKKPNASECEQMICTQEFRMVQVRFKDASGSPVLVRDFSAINKRTGETTAQNNMPAPASNQWNYTVASDADVKKLSEQGDIITVSGIHPSTNSKVSAEIVVSGGKCACHINKISGPSEITF